MSLDARDGEPDALSDLDDWTDVDAASSRDAEDTDTAESDAEPGARSRRSSFGAGERWEGLIASRAESPALVRSPLALNALATEEDLAEDERVQSALAQSMVSTLAASRSSRSSELRLSFPDPIASSREQLVPDAPSSDDTDNLVSDLDRMDVVSIGSAEDIHEATSVPTTQGVTVSPADSILSLDQPVQPAVSAKEDPLDVIKPASKTPKALGVQAWQASTILALLTLALGYIVNAHFQPTASRTDLALKPMTFAPTNTSIPLIDGARSAKDSTAPKNAPRSALSLVPEHNAAVAISAKTPSDLAPVHCPYHARASRDVNTVSSSTAVAAPPSTAPSVVGVSSSSALAVVGPSSSALSVVRTSSSALAVVKPSSSALSIHTPSPRLPFDRKGKAKASAADMSTWLASTLHDTLRALALGLRADAAELHRALDELARAVAAAAGRVHRRLSALAPAGGLRARHRRALDNARRLHAKSGAWLARLRARAGAAREGARAQRKGGRYARRLQRATRRAEHNAKRLEGLVGKALARVL